MSLLVEQPPAYNRLGQGFGNELQALFLSNSKGHINKITVIHDASPSLEGLVVFVPPEPLAGRCVSYQYGTALNTVMSESGIASTLAYSGTADCSSVVVLVGRKPKD